MRFSIGGGSDVDTVLIIRALLHFSHVSGKFGRIFVSVGFTRGCSPKNRKFQVDFWLSKCAVERNAPRFVGVPNFWLKAMKDDMDPVVWNIQEAIHKEILTGSSRLLFSGKSP